MSRVILGVSGASGIILAKHCLESLVELGHQVDLILSKAACYTAKEELGMESASALKLKGALPESLQDLVTCYNIHDMGAAIASGSVRVDAMIVLPCSMATVAAIRHGLGDNLLRRAADVCIKERRPLVLVPRETPLSEIHLENLLGLSKMGISVVPPMPAWYQNPETLADMEREIVGRVLMAAGISTDLVRPWRSLNLANKDSQVNPGSHVA